jgi:hypothetical protein
MKRQHILILLTVVTVMAVTFYFMNKNPAGESASTEDVLNMEQTQVSDTEKDGESAPLDTTVPMTAPMEEKPSSAAAQNADPEAVAAEIRKNLSKARATMQKKAAITQASANEVHHMPRQTLDAARRLGEIAELEAQHPEQAESFREFYLECARDEQTITVTRAQCLDKYVKASSLETAALKELLQEFPEEIVRLFEALQ